MSELTVASVPAQSAARTALRNPLMLVPLAFIAVLVVACSAASLVAPYGPLTLDLAHSLAPPGPSHLLGTDELGRDILSRLLYGGQVSLLAPFVALAVAVLLGVPAGLAAGYRGGLADALLARTADVLLAVPNIVVLLTVLAVFGRSIFITMVALGVLMAPSFMRLVRAGTLVVKRELYVDAARVAGLPPLRIVTRHVLPNVVAPVVIQGSQALAIALLISAGLAFLGLGPTPPAPTWGSMVSEAALYYTRDAWFLLPTGGLITLTAVAFNLIGTATRDVISVRSSSGSWGRLPSVAVDQPPSSALAEPDHDGQALVAVRDLTVCFPSHGGWRPVVQDVSFDIAAGESVALVGESGCGKTITSLALLGLVPEPGLITRGSIRLNGEELRRFSQSMLQSQIRGRRIAFVAQEPMVSLDPAFTIESQITEPLRRRMGLHGASARAAALEALGSVGLARPAEVLRRHPHQLSGGMAQRVAIATALVLEPQVLIADEPTTALDVTTQGEILDLLRDLQQARSMSLLLVTHDLGVVADVCSRAMIMYAGEVVEQGSVRRLYRGPCHPYTRGLLQSNPHGASPGAKLPAIEGVVPRPEDWPLGCHFQARCPLVLDACREAPVELTWLDASHASRCLRALELGGDALQGDER